MSETRGQPEPSMEEILASIRRIISEDGMPAGKEAAPAAAKDGAGKAPPPTPTPPPPATGPTGTLTASAAPRPAAPATGGDDVLVLTEMVADDGTVVSLPTEPGAPALPVEDVSAVAGGAEALPEPPEAEPEAAPPAPEPEPEPAPEPEAAAPAPEPEPMATAPEPPAAQEEEVESMAEEAPAAKPGGLVSDATAAASTAALATLARTVAREKMNQIAGGRTVDDLVREALEPMLKEWLNANLAGLVERLVRQEIERMVQRAEETP